MGCQCNKYDNILENVENNKDPIDSMEVNLNKFQNKISTFYKVFEDHINLLSSMTLQNFLILLNNFQIKLSRETQEIDEPHEAFKNNKSKGDYLNSKEKMINLEEEMNESNFKIFVNKKIVNNPLLKSQNFADEKILFVFQKYLSIIFADFQQFLYKNKRIENLNNIEVPKYLIATIGFNLCKVQRGQKINILFNILANEEQIVKSNFRNNSFIASYLKNAAYLGINYLLDEIDKNKFVKNEDLSTLLGGSSQYKKLTETFAFKNPKEDDFSIIYKFKNKNLNKIQEVEIGQIFEFFVSDVLKMIFGSNRKRELTKDQFKAFLCNEGEGGGFWLLFNEGVRKRFEIFLEHQKI